MKAVKRMNDSGNCVSPAKNRLFDKKTSKIRGQLKVHGKKDSNSAGMSLVVQILTNYCVCCGENKIEYLELDHWLGRNHISYYISDLKNLKSIYIFTDSIQDLTKEMGINPKKVKNLVTSISGHGVSVKQVSTMEMSEDEMINSLEFEARKHIPMDGTDAVIDYQVLGPNKTEVDKIDVALIACTKGVSKLT